MIGLVTDKQYPYKGVLPIWFLCTDSIQRRQMKDAFLSYAKKQEMHLDSPRKVLADVIPIYFTDDEYKATEMDGGIDYIYRTCDLYADKQKKRCYKRISDNILLSGYIAAGQNGYKYFYVTWGYEGEEGLTAMEILDSKTKAVNGGWTVRGSDSHQGVTSVGHSHVLGVKTADIYPGTTITGFGMWEGNNSHDREMWRFLSVKDPARYTWTDGLGIDWYKNYGVAHQWLWISTTGEDLKQGD